MEGYKTIRNLIGGSVLDDSINTRNSEEEWDIHRENTHKFNLEIGKFSYDLLPNSKSSQKIDFFTNNSKIIRDYDKVVDSDEEMGKYLISLNKSDIEKIHEMNRLRLGFVRNLYKQTDKEVIENLYVEFGEDITRNFSDELIDNSPDTKIVYEARAPHVDECECCMDEFDIRELHLIINGKKLFITDGAYNEDVYIEENTTIDEYKDVIKKIITERNK